MAKDRNNGNTAAQQTLADEVYDQYFAAKADKESKGLHTDWATYDDYWRGEQNAAEDEDDPASVTNIVHPLIENQVADLTDATLQIKVKSFDYAGSTFREQVQRFLEWVKDWNHFTIKLERGERWRLKFGTVWSHATFDAKENYPIGMIKLNFENPANVFPDPKVKAPHLIDDADFIILEVVKPLQWFIRNFGETGKLVRSDATKGEGSTIFNQEDPSTALEVGLDQARLIIRYSFDDKGYLRCVKIGGEDSRVVLYDSNEDESLEEKGKDGKKTRKPWLRLKRYPIRPIPCYPKEGQIWGMGDVELIKSIQDLINDLDDQIRLNAQQMAWLIWFINASAGVNVKQLSTRKAGTVVPVRGNPSQMIQAFQPREIPAYLTNRRETAKNEAERVTTRPEVNQGFRPEGVNTFGGLALLQQQGAKTLNHKRKMMLEYLSETFEIALQMGMQLLTEEQGIAYENADGEETFMPFRGSDLAAIPRYYYDPPSKSWKPLIEKGKPMTQEGRWRVQISVQQGLPKDGAFQYQALLALMQSSASQALFQGLGPEDMHRIRKHVFSMVGVQLSDEVPMPPAPQGAPPGAPQGMPTGAPTGAPPEMAQGGPDPRQQIMAEYQRITQGASPEEAQAAFDSLPPQLQDALKQMGVG